MSAYPAVLVLDGHTNQALACVRSLGTAGYPVYTASQWRWPLAAWSRYCRHAFHTSEVSLAGYAQLRERIASHGITVVLPITERSCTLCNADREQWTHAGVSIGCAPQQVLDLAFNKAETLRLAARCGVSYPRTVFPASLDECLHAVAEIGFPCVVKPCFSHAWDGKRFLPDQGCHYVQSGEGLPELFQQLQQHGHWPLVQAFAPGKGKGIFTLCDQGRVVAWFAHERLRDVRPTGSGSSLRRSIPLEARLMQPAERLLAEMRWHGPAMVEFRDDEGHPPCLMEVNGRFWNSLQLAIDAGVDFPRLWLEILRGYPVPPITEYSSEITLRWLWGDMKRLLYIARGKPAGYSGSYPTVREGLREIFGPQPAGTRLETWRRHDPLPAMGEWVQGIREMVVQV